MWHIELSLGNKLKAKEKTTIAREQIRKYATVLEPLLSSGLPLTMEVLLEESVHSVLAVVAVKLAGEARRQFKNSEKGQFPPLEAVTRQRLVKI